MEFVDVYGNMTQLGVFACIIGGVFAILNLWALIVVIVAGHRYLERTNTNAPRPQERSTGRRVAQE